MAPPGYRRCGFIIAACLFEMLALQVGEVAGLVHAVPYMESGELPEGGTGGTPERRAAWWRSKYNLYGTGEVVGVLDTGLDYFHAAFSDASPDWGTKRIRQGQITHPAHRKVHLLSNHFGRTFHNDTRDNCHGTAMSGAVAAAYPHTAAAESLLSANPGGAGLPPLKSSRYTGFAPGARIALHSISKEHDGALNLPVSISGTIEALYAAGVRVVVMAFCGGGPRYTLALGKLAATYPDLMLVGAAGNKGVEKCAAQGFQDTCSMRTVCHPHTSANVLTVGAHRALPQAKADLGYPGYFFELRCAAAAEGEGEATIQVAAHRAEFSPFSDPPLHVADAPLAWHPRGATGCSNSTAARPLLRDAAGMAFPDGPGGASSSSISELHALPNPSRAPRGAVLLAKRGACPFSEKALNAAGGEGGGRTILLVIDTNSVVDGPMQVEEGDTRRYIQTFMVSKEEYRTRLAGRACSAASGPFLRGGSAQGSAPRFLEENALPGFHPTQEDLLPVSGRGAPAARQGTLRGKPDLVAPGEMVLLPRANTTSGLIAHTGSSPATALMGGAAAVLREALLRCLAAEAGEAGGGVPPPPFHVIFAADRGSPVHQAIFPGGVVGGGGGGGGGGFAPPHILRPGFVPAALIRAMLVHCASGLQGVVDLTGEGRFASLKMGGGGGGGGDEGAPESRDPFQGFGRVAVNRLFAGGESGNMRIVEALLHPDSESLRVGFSLSPRGGSAGGGGGGAGGPAVTVTLSWTVVQKATSALLTAHTPSGGGGAVAEAVSNLDKRVLAAEAGFWLLEVALPQGGRGRVVVLPVYLVLTLPDGFEVEFRNGTYGCAELLPYDPLRAAGMRGSRGSGRQPAASHLVLGHTKEFWDVGFFLIAAPGIVIAMVVFMKRRASKGSKAL